MADDGRRLTLPEPMLAADLFGDAGSVPVLVVLNGPQVGQRIRLEGPASIGRDPLCDLMLTDPAAGWRHALVESRDGDWWLTVFVEGGAKEASSEPASQHHLRRGERFQLGETVVLFEFHDPIEQAYDDAVLERLNTDELTGLLARRKFEMELRSAISAALRGDEQVVLLMVDIDNLKPVNDAHGHLAGAQVIARVGELLEEVFGQSSFACRLGGDEFAVARRGGVAEALELTESLLALVRRDPFEIDGRSFAIRVSVGIAVLPDDAGAVGELFRRADKALYEAKAFGGDRARRWNAP